MSQTDRKGWMPRNQWEARKGGRTKEGERKLASETKMSSDASTTPQRPGPSPRRAANPNAPIQSLRVPQEGTDQGPKARNVPTEQGLASAKVDGQDPPMNDKGIQYREKVVSDHERGGIIITVIIIFTRHRKGIKISKGSALSNGRNVEWNREEGSPSIE